MCDISHHESEAQKQDVEKVLLELDLDPMVYQSRMIEVWNKIDKLPDDQREHMLTEGRFRNVVPLSALTGEGIDTLYARIEQVLAEHLKQISIVIPSSEGKAISWLYSHATILDRKDDEGVCVLSLSIEPGQADRFIKTFPNLGYLISD